MLPFLHRTGPDSLDGDNEQSKAKDVGDEIAGAIGKAERDHDLDHRPAEGEIDDEDGAAAEPEQALARARSDARHPPVAG